MSEGKRVFTPEYRQEAVQVVLGSGKSTSSVARDLGIAESTLKTWVRNATTNGRDNGLDVDERAELARLRRELKTVRMERDFLKKAAAWFASHDK